MTLCKVLDSMMCLGVCLMVLTGNRLAQAEQRLHKYRASPRFGDPPRIMSHAANDSLLNELDSAMAKISNVYMQALFDGTHTPELDMRMRGMELELFDLLDALFKQNRLSDYIKYEAEVTRQMIIYTMLKKLFGYAQEGTSTEMETVEANASIQEQIIWAPLETEVRQSASQLPPT